MKGIKLWVNKVVGELFAAEERRFRVNIQSLCDENTVLTGEKCYGFMFQGIYYTNEHLTYTNSKTLNKKSLHFLLTNKVTEFIIDKRKVDIDKVKITQMFTLLTEDCHTITDFRDCIPEFVVQLSCLKDIARGHYDPLDRIRYNPQHMQQYENLLPLMHMYSVTHLLY